jgi:hypothetical protein
MKNYYQNLRSESIGQGIWMARSEFPTSEKNC